MDTRTPIEQITKRTAEALPGLASGAKAVGLLNHMQTLKDHRQRLADAHRIQMKALGLEPGEPQPSQAATSEQSGDEMGDQIFICGDIMQPPQQAAGGGQQAAAMTFPTTELRSSPSWPKKLALGAALVAGGAAIPLAGSAIQNFKPPTVIVEQAPPAPQVKPFDPNDYELRLVPES